MRTIVAAAMLLSTLSATSMRAQDPRTFASSADIDAAVAKLKASANPQPAMASAPLLSSSPYNVSVEYRTAPATAAMHNFEAELMVIHAGSGTLVLGGTLDEPHAANPANATGKSISGGVPRTVHAGDIILIPLGTPHFFSAIESPLTVLAMHIPAPKP